MPRALAREPAPFVAANSTYSLRLRLSLSEGRPALAAAHRVCLGGRRPPFWRKGTPKTGKHRPPRALAREPAPFVEDNSTYSLRLRQSPSEGRPAGRPLNEFALGPQAPFWRKGTPKTGKRRPPHFSVCLSPFGLAPTVIYRAHPSLWTSAGKTRWWGSRCGGRARRGCRWRPRTPSRARRSRRRG